LFGSGTPGGRRVARVRPASDQGARRPVAAGRRGRRRAGGAVVSRRSGRPAVPLSGRSAVVLGVASIAGLMMLGWPLLVQVPEQAHVDPPFLFLLLLPVVIAVVLAEISEGGMDPRVLAVLGVLSAVNALLRGLSAGT